MQITVKPIFTRSLIGAAALALAACSSTPVAPPAAAPVATATPAPAPDTRGLSGAQTAPAAASTVTTVTLPDHLDPKSAVASQRSVFFEFDETLLTAEDNTVIERHGKYLASKPALNIRVEGNTDERGSTEYNLALGQKRAQAVITALKIYGVKDGQVEAVSWGEEKPRAAGHDESAWSQNRRADLQYPSK